MTSGLLQFFVVGHLPAHLQVVSEPFARFAHHMHDKPKNSLVELEGLLVWVERELPLNPERTWAVIKLEDAKRLYCAAWKDEDAYRDGVLRKVLEAKDCAVRAILYKEPQS